MTLRSIPKPLTATRGAVTRTVCKGEIAFLIFGAGVFAFGVAAASAICIACAAPAIVTVSG